MSARHHSTTDTAFVRCVFYTPKATHEAKTVYCTKWTESKHRLPVKRKPFPEKLQTFAKERHRHWAWSVNIPACYSTLEPGTIFNPWIRDRGISNPGIPAGLWKLPVYETCAGKPRFLLYRHCLYFADARNCFNWSKHETVKAALSLPATHNWLQNRPSAALTLPIFV